MSFTKSKYDGCFLEQQKNSNKSIFDYVTDNTKFVNQNECNNYQAPFLTYIPTGISHKSVDIENELKGMTRAYTRCTECKYTPTALDAKPQPLDVPPHNKKECPVQFNILPNGYVRRV